MYLVLPTVLSAMNFFSDSLFTVFQVSYFLEKNAFSLSLSLSLSLAHTHTHTHTITL